MSNKNLGADRNNLGVEAYYICTPGADRRGPYTDEQLRNMWLNGNITADTLINVDDKWQSLGIWFVEQQKAVEAAKSRHNRRVIVLCGLGITLSMVGSGLAVQALFVIGLVLLAAGFFVFFFL